jgi:hypothetical protein
MLEFGKEYFEKPYYFYLKDRGDKFSVYFSVSETLTESRGNDEEVIILKENLSKIKNFIKKLFSSEKKFSKDQIKKLLNKLNLNKSEKEGGELQEFIGADGSFTKSNIPMLNQRLVAKNTTDQTVRMTRANQFPFIRVYYGESKEEKDNLIDEVNMFDSFGYRETKNAKTYKQASRILKNMGVEDPFERHERLEVMGFDPEYDKQLKMIKRRGYGKNWFSKRRLSELEKGKMQKMIDEIILGKKNKNLDVLDNKKDTNSSSVVEKILIRNLESVKKLADKEGLELKDLLNKLNKGE